MLQRNLDHRFGSRSNIVHEVSKRALLQTSSLFQSPVMEPVTRRSFNDFPTEIVLIYLAAAVNDARSMGFVPEP